MKRTGFARNVYEPALPAPLCMVERSGVYRASAEVRPAPKDEKAKPGKRAPTVAEKQWMGRIVEFGCIACHLDGKPGVPACVHHILRGGRRMGHLYTLPLCPGHHQHDTASGLVARHPYKAQFEEMYGPELQLLGWLRGAIEGIQ